MTAPGPVRTLDVYELACLAGGIDRMVDAALVALVQTGRVQVPHPGQLVTAGLARRHPVEAAVLDAVGPAGHRSVDTVRWRLTGDERLLDVVRRLHRDGLVGRHVPHPSAAGRRTLHRLIADPPQDDVAPGTDALLVALHGREQWPDRELCAAVFAVTRTVRPFTRGSRSTRRAEAAAEALRDVRRTPALINRSASEFFAPCGPNPTMWSDRSRRA
jgi:hypothetical protein